MKLEDKELSALKSIAQEEQMIQLKAENLKLAKQNTGFRIEKRLGIELSKYSIDLNTGEISEVEK